MSKQRITITIPEGYLENLQIHFEELDLSVSKQISLAVRGFLYQVIKERNQTSSNGGVE